MRRTSGAFGNALVEKLIKRGRLSADALRPRITGTKYVALIISETAKLKPAPKPEKKPRTADGLSGSQRAHESLCKSARDYFNKVLRWNCYRTDVVAARGADGRFLPRSEPGLPDLLVLLPWGVTAYVEVKTGRAYLNPNQRTRRDEILATGAPHYVCRDLSALMAWAAELEANK